MRQNDQVIKQPQVIKQQIEETILNTIIKYTEQTNRQIPIISIKYNLTGKTAAQFCRKNNTPFYRFNLKLAQENPSHYLSQTVPHEVAHHIVSIIKPSAKPHGIAWQTTMKILEKPTTIYHNYKATPARQHKQYTHTCKQCHITATFTKRLYKSMIATDEYRCSNCKAPIVIIDLIMQNNR